MADEGSPAVGAMATGPADTGEPTTGVSVRQQALPMLRVVLQPAGEDRFAHPAERDFARILSYHRIRWSYEPTTFTLARTADGRPAQMFTPDFYLPDQRVYIELTTMRQRLVTRKNRKVRQLRALYPNVRIKLVYRRDFQRLVESYRTDGRRLMACGVGRVLYPADAIRARVNELAAQIAADQPAIETSAMTVDASARPGTPSESLPLLIVGVGRGATVFLGALASALTELGLPFDLDRLDLTRYRTSGGARYIRVRRGPRTPLAGRRVLLVEDVVSTGFSLRYLSGWLRQRRAAEVEVCTLLDRRAARLIDAPVRYAGFEAPNELLVGFGLALRRQFRDLPYIAVVAPE